MNNSLILDVGHNVCHISVQKKIKKIVLKSPCIPYFCWGFTKSGLNAAAYRETVEQLPSARLYRFMEIVEFLPQQEFAPAGRLGN